MLKSDFKPFETNASVKTGRKSSYTSRFKKKFPGVGGNLGDIARATGIPRPLSRPCTIEALLRGERATGPGRVHKRGRMREYTRTPCAGKRTAQLTQIFIEKQINDFEQIVVLIVSRAIDVRVDTCF